MRTVLAKGILATLLVLTPSSCITATVWGGGVEERENGPLVLRWSGDEPLSDSVWINLLVTPFALALDICTCPVQAYLFGVGNYQIH